jgi:hypothetical protein
MIAWIAIALQLLSAQSFAEGGGGVKNGGSGLRCLHLRPGVIMLELAEALQDRADIAYTTDRNRFFAEIVAMLHQMADPDANLLANRLMKTLWAHGPSGNWKKTPYLVPTILNEDILRSQQVERVDWVSGTVYLLNGCQILPISYLTPGTHLSPVPPMTSPNYPELDAFNLNVLELHEAFYDIYTTRNYLTVNVLPTRMLIRVLLNRKITIERKRDEVRRFMFVGYVFPAPFPLNPPRF